MTDRTRSTTLKLRLPLPAGANVGPSAAGLPPRVGTEPQRFTPRPVVAMVPRGLDPTSKAILEELAALGLAEDAPQ